MKITPKAVSFLSAMICSVIVCGVSVVRAQGITPVATADGVSFQLSAPHETASLRVRQPDGVVFEQRFARGQPPAFTASSGILADGSYVYEIVVAPLLTANERARIEQARETGAEIKWPSSKVESGTFRVAQGRVVLPRPEQTRPANPESQTIADFVTITGLDTRLNFVDTSGLSGTTNDWQLRANSNAFGGDEFFAIVDQDTGGGGTESGNIPFRIDAGAPTNSLRIAEINGTGYVGLGTGMPVASLHIANASHPSLRLEQTAGSGAHTWEIYGNSFAGFRFDDITRGVTLLTMETATGNVGIGTTAPAGRFHVNGAGNQVNIFQSSDNQAVQFRLQTNSTNRRFVALNTAGQQQSQLLFGDDGAFDFLGPTAADVRMRLLASGNVGIGTSTPDQKLSVNGNASKPGGGSWATFSDERLKNIKGKYRGGLAEVLRLEPIRYEYKDDNAIGIRSPGEHIGFGAQEVREVIPEAVTQNADGYLMVDNDPILWTMLNAIKEQNARIEKQEAEIRSLRERDQKIVQLQEQLDRLQARDRAPGR